MSRTRFSIGVVLLALLGTVTMSATIPPRGNRAWPEALLNRLEDNPRFFTYQNAFQRLALTIRANRVAAANSGTLASMSPQQVAITGQRSIPVLAVKFSDSPSASTAPISTTELQRELFGSWPTGTMTDFYRAMSYNLFTVTGTVSAWARLKQNTAVYAGPDEKPGRFCNGVCPGAAMPQMIKESLDANKSIDWRQFDNDGPDDTPNSGDDDGFVDFVAFVQPAFGGECDVANNRNIWSHRSSLANWGAASYVTPAKTPNGAAIRINDYVVMPALACDGKTMIEIGVFAHEFGHAFGLPDLYDTTNKLQGAGNWCLMSGGSWGGDGNSPESPVYLSAWARSYLGWVTPLLVTKDLPKTAITPIANAPVAYKLQISSSQYYLLENRQRIKNDSKLPQAGLLVWKINDTVINAAMASNTVNADPSNKGVALVEAAGRELDMSLQIGGNHGDANDPFPGSKLVRRFDRTSTPRAIGTNAICDIAESGADISVVLKKSASTCAAQPLTNTPEPPAAPKPASTNQPAPGGQQGARPSLAQIAANPSAFAGRLLTIEGTVQNAGTNYFRDRRIVLRDSSGAEFPVGRTPLPLESRPGGLASVDEPPALSTVLGKPAVVIGVVRRDPNNPDRFVLDLTDVKVK